MKLKRTLARLMTVAVVVALVTSLIGIASVVTANAGVKSLYVITNINASPSPIDAYSIQGTGLVYQTTSTVPYRGIGAVGLAIDSVAEYLFVTYESSNTIQLVDATTMTDAGTTTAPGASNLAGIVVDEGKQKVYAIDRYTNKLYSYLWNAGTQTLTLEGGTFIPLPTANSLVGIALDEGNDLLYVGDQTTSVKVYNTSDWSLAGQFSVSGPATDVSIDEANQCFYVTFGWAGLTTMSKFAISDFATGSGTETVVNVGSMALGVAVDQATGLVYITTYGSGTRQDRLLVYDGPNLTGASVPTWSSGDLGNPTGLVIPRGGVSYNPLNLSKADSPDPVNPGQNLTYTISYDNLGNNFPVNNVGLADNLPPEVTFVSATGGGFYDAVTHTVTWNIGTLPANDPGGSVTVTVQVKPGTPPGTTITDTCSINSNETGQAWANEDTLVPRDGEPPVIEVGGEVYPVNKLAILAPWIALAAVIIAGATIAVRRRRAKS